MKLSNYIISTSIEDGDAGADAISRIIYSCVSNVTVVVNEFMFTSLTNGRFDLLDDGIKNELENVGILVPDERDEFAAILLENESSNGTFSLFLNLSEACKSGCVSFASKQENIVLTDVLSKELNRYTEVALGTEKYQSFHVTWKVDDPVKDLPTIIQFSESNLIFAERYPILYISSMICDGVYLKEEVFETLFNQCGIKKYHVSLADTQESEGSKTRQTIDNVLSILEDFPFLPQDGIIFEIGINISKFSQEAVVDMIDKFAAAKTQNRITFQFEFTENEHADKEELGAFEIECLVYAIQKGFIQGILPARTLIPCVAVDKGAVAVDLHGNLFSCNLPPSASPEIIDANLIGNLLEDWSTNSKDTQFRNWFQKIKNGDSECSGCSLFPVCGGGCHLKWLEGKRGCPSFKYNMEDRLLLSYLNQKTRMNEYIIED